MIRRVPAMVHYIWGLRVHGNRNLVWRLNDLCSGVRFIGFSFRPKNGYWSAEFFTWFGSKVGTTNRTSDVRGQPKIDTVGVKHVIALGEQTQRFVVFELV